ncbi:hypothetical protein TL16_g09791 [Triparma laevis f. inornata]|uniref:PNPLA domain-containing protein n=1 Tax=Triparma laevis f. inornata TaxID=1714386 RepID=A0A9W7B4S8_9STRA|nr:hypothetical protein TL16_g09791 [Triparma laevis f. inornata]
MDSVTTSSGLLSIKNPLNVLKGLLENFGWFKGEVLEAEIDRLIGKKTGVKGMTFAGLLKYNRKRLRVTATCVTTQRLLWLDADSYPDMKISKAVHASSAIPFFYQPVLHDGLLLVDGGCIRNLPHDAFRGEEGSMLALSLRPGGADLKALENRNITSLLEFSSQLVETLLFGPDSANSLVNMKADDNEKLDLVSIDYGTVGTVDFGLSQVRKLWLVQQGWKATVERLSHCRGKVIDPPPWLVEMKLQAEQEQEEAEAEEERRRKLENELPEEIKKGLEEMKASLDAFAIDFDVCMQENDRDVAKCCLQAGKVSKDLPRAYTTTILTIFVCRAWWTEESYRCSEISAS